MDLHLIIISTMGNLAPFFILVSPKLLVASSAELRTQRLTLTCSISVADSVSSFLSLETHLSTHCPPPAPEDSVSLFANTPIIVSLQSKANKHTNQSSHSYFSTYLYWLPSSPSTDPLRPAVLSFVPVIYFTHVNTVNLLFTVWVCFLGLFKKGQSWQSGCLYVLPVSPTKHNINHYREIWGGFLRI